jgi:hypothetical protein
MDWVAVFAQMELDATKTSSTKYQPVPADTSNLEHVCNECGQPCEIIGDIEPATWDEPENDCRVSRCCEAGFVLAWEWEAAQEEVTEVAA